ncbi:tetratricopeptide repeat protein [Methylobacterium sp. SyP6R]|uniref:tetratricopeptide repeat protein n=1 Tax=Methylobacterium sp. SyP6R TaxID=2718876 RepID=UPI001F2D22C2|nr:tetratricopeptide repeat protein [Methylobacterium sp. SyP6R]MCF4127302.1 tetratricopeptide repeat protein [Methylobacterium sp. SyP6R]
MTFQFWRDAEAARHDRAALAEVARRVLYTNFASADEIAAARVVQIGILARDAGLRAEALALFDRMATIAPSDIASRYEKAVLFLHEGSHIECAQVLRQILAHHPHEDRTNLMAARVLHALGAHGEASACLDRIPLQGRPDRAEWERQIRIVHDFGRYVAAFPRIQALGMAERIERSPTHISVGTLAERITAALESRSGFSLVRAGDGEGAFAFLGNEDEAEYAHLYVQNRLDRARVWFADTVDPTQHPFLGEAFRITDVIRDADVAGMPYPNWIRHEYTILSVTGISSLTNLLRIERRPDAATCTQMIHVELHNTKLLYKIMQSQKEIGLISCHPGLPERLKSVLGYKAVDYHHVPGEKGHSHLLSEEAVAGSHWPERYPQIMDALSRPLDGRLYIVAAGLLGKFYCDRIKKSGGVALDVGSIADGWMGSRTRPGLEQLSIG